jgi:hypothetical protein
MTALRSAWARGDLSIAIAWPAEGLTRSTGWRSIHIHIPSTTAMTASAIAL